MTFNRLQASKSTSGV